MVAGPISALNYIAVPRPSSNKSLGATGRYMYLHVKLHPAQFFVINIEVTTSDRGTVRLAISNMKDKARRRPLPAPRKCPIVAQLRVANPPPPPRRWCAASSCASRRRRTSGTC